MYGLGFAEMMVDSVVHGDRVPEEDGLACGHSWRRSPAYLFAGNVPVDNNPAPNAIEACIVIQNTPFTAGQSIV